MKYLLSVINFTAVKVLAGTYCEYGALVLLAVKRRRVMQKAEVLRNGRRMVVSFVFIDTAE
jgi:hypothetical protein